MVKVNLTGHDITTMVPEEGTILVIRVLMVPFVQMKKGNSLGCAVQELGYSCRWNFWHAIIS